MPVAAGAIFYKLGTGSLQGDEAIYAALSRAIVDHGGWVVMHFNSSPWLEKPPLYVWTSAVLYRLFGANEFWTRMPAAVSAMGMLLFTYLLARRLFGRPAGLVAATVALLTPPLLFTSRFGNVDMMLTMFTVAAIYAYVRTQADARYWIACGAACGLAVMTKGAGAGVAVLPLAALMLIDMARGRLSRGRWLLAGIAVGLAIAIPWHLAALLQAPEVFWGQYLGKNVVARVAVPLEGHVGGPLFYVAVLASTYEPWLPLLVVAAWLALGAAWRREADTHVALIPMALTFVLYSLAVRTKQNWYILPMYPFAAILVGYAAVRVQQTWPRLLRLGGAAAAAAAVVLVAVPSTRHRVAHYLGDTYARPTYAVAATAALSHDNPAPAGQPLLVLAGLLEREHYPVAPVFYSDRPLVLLARPGDALAYLAGYEHVDAVLDDAAVAGLTAQGVSLRILGRVDGDVYVRLG